MPTILLPPHGVDLVGTLVKYNNIKYSNKAKQSTNTAPAKKSQF